MAPKTSNWAPDKDKYLQAGVIGVIVDHPITHKPVESLLQIANYSQDGKGVQKLIADINAGKLAPSHDGASTADIVNHVFAQLIDKRDQAFVDRKMASADDAIAKAQAQAALSGWRTKLDQLDDGGTQILAQELFTELTKAQEVVNDVQARMADLKSETADRLGIDKTFDLAFVSTGFYISSETQASTVGGAVPRDYTPDHYECKRTKNGIELFCTADVTSRDQDGNPTGWICVYNIMSGKHKGKSFDGSADTLNKADSTPRLAVMALIAPDQKPANNAPVWYHVKPIKS